MNNIMIGNGDLHMNLVIQLTRVQVESEEMAFIHYVVLAPGHSHGQSCVPFTGNCNQDKDLFIAE